MVNRIVHIVIVSMLFFTSVMANQLKIGTNPEYPPFEFKDDENKLTGFDIDLMDAICEFLDKECVYLEQTFDALIPQLRQRRFDLIISAIDITELRQKQVLFSDPYYLNYSIYITTKDKVDKINNIGDFKIGVLSGSTHQQYIRNNFKGADISSYPEYPSSISDLLVGRIDIVFGDGEVVYDYMKDNETLIVYGDKVTDEKYFGKGLAIAARKSDQELIDAVNRALKELRESGRYDEIYNKWFSESSD